MFTTKRFPATGTSCTAPSAKSFVALSRYHDRYAASGSRQRREIATTNPFPQPPASLQTCATILGPTPFGAVASPTRYSISPTTPPTVSPPTDNHTRASDAGVNKHGNSVLVVRILARQCQLP